MRTTSRLVAQHQTFNELNDAVIGLIHTRLNEDRPLRQGVERHTAVLDTLVSAAIKYELAHALWLTAWLALVNDAANKTPPTQKKCDREGELMDLLRMAGEQLGEMCHRCGISYGELTRGLEALRDIETNTVDEGEANA